MEQQLEDIDEATGASMMFIDSSWAGGILGWGIRASKLEVSCRGAGGLERRLGED